jgi:2-polyprenyl-3-methyl-5-hydroxy-6-metoxy-1,4-benzoquinol methylase
MERIWVDRTYGEQIDYHLADGRAPIFDEGQPGRVEKAREYVDQLIADFGRPVVIRELGCGAADISGRYAEANEVYGYDVVPMAETVALERFPAMQFRLGPIERVTPEPCDILVLCEVLEHIYDPVRLVNSWLPLAKSVIIGHPLNEPKPYVEAGHIWRYNDQDYMNWFHLGGHQLVEVTKFSMGPFPEMVIGYGKREGSA